MSLDVYLHCPGVENRAARRAIVIREDGATKEISLEDWQQRHLFREPCTVEIEPDDTVFHQNITHNLATMARAAGIYTYLWRPEELGITTAQSLIQPLQEGLARLCATPEVFRRHNPPNGWGSYEGLVAFVSAYLEACTRYPSAELRVSR